jgi:RHS repeat-associated protein
VAQAVSQAGWAENFLELAADSQNRFLIDVGSTSINFESKVNGVRDVTTLAYDPALHHYWRVRHDQNSNTIKFETSTDGLVWTTRKSVSPGFSLTSLRISLVAGAWGTGNGNPGAAKYDNFKLLPSTAGSVSVAVANYGFESPSVGYGNFQYGPTGGAWTFASAGVSAAGSGFTSGTTVPEGAQVAFLQGAGSIISQSISGFQAGTNYVVTFAAAQRTNCCNAGGQDFQVYLDNTLLGTFHPASGSYADYSTQTFTTTAGAHTLKFVGVNSLGGDHTAFIDNVRITGSPVAAGAGLQWLVSDQLGTPRMVLDKTGSLSAVKRHDYLPYGEELYAGMGGRTWQQGYVSDSVRQKFTGYEHDAETSLEFAQARYYSSSCGRFTSPDLGVSTFE